MTAVLSFAALSASLAPRAGAQQDPLERAKALFRRQAYDQALVLLGQARSASTTPAERARSWLWEGFVRVGLDRPDEARAAFRRALRLDPTLTLPPQTSPKIAAVFDAASAAERQRRERRRLARARPPTARPPAVAERAFTVGTRVEHPFDGLGVRLRIERAGQLVGVLPMRSRGADGFEVLVPAAFAAAAARLELRVELVDGRETFNTAPASGRPPVSLQLPAHRAALRLRSPLRGARIVVAGREIGRVPHRALIPVRPGQVAIRLESSDGTVEETVGVGAGQIKSVLVSRGPGISARTVTRYALAGTGLASVILGTAFTVLAGNAERDVEQAAQQRTISGLPETTYGTVEATDQRGRAFGVAGTVCLIAGGAALAASLTLWLWPRSDETPREPRLGLGAGSLRVTF